MEREIVGTYGLLIKTGETFIPLVCQTDLNFDRSRGSIAAPSKCDPNKKIPNPTGDYELSGTLQILLSDGDGFDAKASEAEVDALFKNRTVFDWQIGPLSGEPQPGDIIYSGKGWLSNLSSKYPTADLATNDFTLVVTGEYATDIEPALT
jgi:hypothetical protein